MLAVLHQTINRTRAAEALPRVIGRPCRIVGNGEEIRERSIYIPKRREAGFMG